MKNIFTLTRHSIILFFLLSMSLFAKPAPLKVFFAGDLFSHKDLIGNIYLADAIKKISNNKYELFLAQNKIQQKVHHKVIKDQDLKALVESDIAIFAFDGVELDSGTVVEFMSAKFLDKPSVVYRTDFRGGSGEEVSIKIDEENVEQNNKWNLMASFYPRTKVLYLNGMVEYQKVFKLNDRTDFIAKTYSESIAHKIISAMEEVYNTPKIIDTPNYQIKKETFYKLMNIDPN